MSGVGLSTIRPDVIVMAEAITIKTVTECPIEAKILLVSKDPLGLFDFTFF
jgi:hypothetical protein